MSLQGILPTQGLNPRFLPLQRRRGGRALRVGSTHALRVGSTRGWTEGIILSALDQVSAPTRQSRRAQRWRRGDCRLEGAQEPLLKQRVYCFE